MKVQSSVCPYCAEKSVHRAAPFWVSWGQPVPRHVSHGRCCGGVEKVDAFGHESVQEGAMMHHVVSREKGQYRNSIIS